MKQFKEGVIVLFLAICCNISCAKPTVQKNIDSTQKSFELPKIPVAINTDKDRLEYLLVHYWDGLDAQDSLSEKSQEIEQAFSNYIDLFNRAESQIIDKSLQMLFNKVAPQSNQFNWFTDKFEHYLYETESPLRNDAQYIQVLENLLANAHVDPIYKSRYDYQFQEVNKNKVGDIAANFTYQKVDAKEEDLHDIKAKYTLIFFYDPDCHNCKEAKETLMSSSLINELQGNHDLAILAFYPYDDVDFWKQNADKIPSTWINSHDASEELLVDNQLYAIRSIPSLYLLDRDKRVILRDVFVEDIFQFFSAKVMK
ncbi:MAG: DUF5106 domain-containing protein [Mangrovibacterium sp.]